MSKETTCCFTGHRPEKMPFPFDRYTYAFFQFTDGLRSAIEQSINLGFDTFITGMSRGADLWSAQILLDLQHTYPHIRLNAAVPYPEQARRWCRGDVQLYNDILQKCNDVRMISQEYHRGCMQARNRYMVDNSSLVIAAYVPGLAGGTAYTCQYAQRSGVPVLNVLTVLGSKEVT